MRSITKTSVIFVLMSCFAVGSLWADYRLVIQAGHEGAPTAMEWHEKSRTIVSTGDDGRMIVTRPSDSRVLHRFRVSAGSISVLRTNPAENRAALVNQEKDGFVVRVWDWEDEKILYEYEMENEPLFVRWSAHGRYLTIGQLNTPSVVVLEGRTGRKLSYLRRLPSIYNDAYIGATESILMTYSSSGSIRYWDIRSSALKLSTETTGNLRGLSVLQTGSKSTLFAHKNQTLFLVNRQTGAILDQIDVPGLIDVSVDPENGELDALSSSMEGVFLHEYEVSSDRFLPRDFPESALSRTAIPKPLGRSLDAVKVIRRNGDTFLMNSQGAVLALGESADFQPIIGDKLWRPDSLAFLDGSLFISSGAQLIQFNADFFDNDAKGTVEELEGLSKKQIAGIPETRNTGLLTLEGGRLLVWDRLSGSVLRGYSIIDTANPDFPQRFPLDSNIQKAELLEDGRLLLVDRNGTILLVDPLSGETLTSYSALGILDAGYSSDGDYILAGRSSAGRAGTPLEQVDLQTRETVPVADNRFMVYAIKEGPRSLYSLGVSRSGGETMSTVLKQHEKSNPARSRTILEINGEDMNAVILPHPSGNGVYTSLGGTVQRISGSRKTVFRSREPIEKLFLQGSVLYGVDADGAVVLWNAANGREILRVHFFEDGGTWIAIPPDGDTIWASPGAIDNVVLYKNGRPVDPRRISRTIDGKLDENPDRG